MKRQLNRRRIFFNNKYTPPNTTYKKYFSKVKEVLLLKNEASDVKEVQRFTEDEKEAIRQQLREDNRHTIYMVILKILISMVILVGLYLLAFEIYYFFTYDSRSIFI